MGALILQNEADLDVAAIVAYEHHIMLNGGGYPRLHYRRDCALASRLVHVCDVYDALRTNRPYRDAWSAEKAEASGANAPASSSTRSGPRVRDDAAGGPGGDRGPVRQPGQSEGTVPDTDRLRDCSLCESTGGLSPFQSHSSCSGVAFTQSTQFCGKPIGQGIETRTVSALRSANEHHGQSCACFTSWAATGFAST